LLALTAALMEPVIHWPSASVSVVYLLDISRSVSGRSIEASLDWIEKTNRDRQPAQARFIPFARNSAVFANLEQVKDVDVNSIDQTGTNIQGAIDRAIQSFDPHGLKRLVLISDGNENVGGMDELLGRLKKERIRVYTKAEATQSNADAWIDSVIVPAQTEPGELFPVDVRLYSQVNTTGEVRLKSDGGVLQTRRLQLKAGLNRVSFEIRMAEGSASTLEAEVRTVDDAFDANNVFRQTVAVTGRPRILYVESRNESTKYFQQALQLEGFAVDVVPPTRIPAEVAEFDKYDAVILSDVARSSMNDRQMASLATYVRDLGGGFILSGGENNYGDGGYAKTPVEKILPIRFDADKEKTSVAMIVVLDKSGSMGGLKMELAKEATKASVEFLKENDRFGNTSFCCPTVYRCPVILRTSRRKWRMKGSLSPQFH
jgi:hypothetical protein